MTSVLHLWRVAVEPIRGEAAVGSAEADDAIRVNPVAVLREHAASSAIRTRTRLQGAERRWLQPEARVAPPPELGSCGSATWHSLVDRRERVLAAHVPPHGIGAGGGDRAAKLVAEAGRATEIDLLQRTIKLGTLAAAAAATAEVSAEVPWSRVRSIVTYPEHCEAGGGVALKVPAELPVVAGRALRAAVVDDREGVLGCGVRLRR